MKIRSIFELKDPNTKFRASDIFVLPDDNYNEAKALNLISEVHVSGYCRRTFQDINNGKIINDLAIICPRCSNHQSNTLTYSNDLINLIKFNLLINELDYPIQDEYSKKEIQITIGNYIQGKQKALQKKRSK